MYIYKQSHNPIGFVEENEQKKKEQKDIDNEREKKKTHEE